MCDLNKVRWDNSIKIRAIQRTDINNIKVSSRAITIIDIDGVEITDDFIEQANYFLELLRFKTHDVILSPFKNNNKLGQRRRRLDYYWARKIIEKTMEALDK